MEYKNLLRLWRALQSGAALAGAYFCRFVGGMDALMKALLIMMALDYLTGLMSAYIEKRLSSEIGFKGIAKKALILILVGAGTALDAGAPGLGGALRGAVIGFYLSNEALSIAENAARLGLPVPEKLKRALKQMQDGAKAD